MLLPPQPSSGLTPALTNAVRIEKLSDDEDEDVDITDDLSDQGDESQAEVKSEPSEPEGTQSPSEEPEEPGTSEGDAAQQTEDGHGRGSRPPPPRQHSSSLPCLAPAEPDETASLPPGRSQTHWRQVKDEGQSAEQLEQDCGEGTGKPHLL